MTSIRKVTEMKETQIQQNSPKSMAERRGTKINEIADTVRERPVSTLIVLAFSALMAWWFIGMVSGDIPIVTTLPYGA
nr:hypothetical protein [Rhodococcus qingshengii]